MHKKSTVLLSMLILMFGFLTGCSAKGSEAEVDATTICIDEDGTVTHKIIEPFDGANHNVEALTSFIQEEIKEYNTEKGEEAVTLVSVEEITAEDGTKNVSVVMTYLTAEDYRDCNGKLLFYGTVSQAIEAGYDIHVELKSVKDDSKSIGAEQIKAMGESHIVIYEENVQISLTSPILYINPECELINKYMATGNSTAVHTYIITK